MSLMTSALCRGEWVWVVGGRSFEIVYNLSGRGVKICVPPSFVINYLFAWLFEVLKILVRRGSQKWGKSFVFLINHIFEFFSQNIYQTRKYLSNFLGRAYLRKLGTPQRLPNRRLYVSSAILHRFLIGIPLSINRSILHKSTSKPQIQFFYRFFSKILP